MSAPLRSLLFAPGNEPRKVQKVGTFGADAVILDLEDAVPLGRKAASRAPVKVALASLKGTLACVRVNGIDTGLTEADVDGVMCPDLDAVVLPMATSAAHVQQLAGMLEAAEQRKGMPVGSVRILVLVETARGVHDACAVAMAHDRVLTLLFGSGDFTRDLELPSVRSSGDGSELFYARGKIVVESRAAGRSRPVDGPYLAVRDLEGFEAECRVALRLGFQGKLCIHPGQVRVANRVFSPDPDEVAFCARVVEAFRDAEASGSASITVDGVFVDYPIAEKAERVLELARTLAARDAADAAREPA